MKNVLFLLLLSCIAFIAAAQPAQIADTIARPGLPVLRSYVAPDVVKRAIKKYGRSLYSIEKALAPDCENSYLVGLLRDGKSLQMEFMCDNLRMVRRAPQRLPVVVASSLP